MAQRPIATYREVTSQGVEANSDIGVNLGLKALEITGQIMKQNAEAKIVENISKAQLELNELTNQYQIDNEANPMGAQKDFGTRKKALFDKYGADIPSNYKYAWDKQVFDLSTKNDISNQAWALKQTKTNTVNSINSALKSSYMQSYIDGKNVGDAETSDLSAVANFAQNKANLMEFGTRNLGSETTSTLLKEFDNDSMKSFLSGVIETNPVSALNMMESDDVKSMFDPKDYQVMHKAAKNRALNLDTIREQNKLLEAIQAPNSLLAQAQNRQLSIAEIEQASRQYGLDGDTKEYILRRSGYSKKEVGEQEGKPQQEAQDEKPQKAPASTKLEIKGDLFNAVSALSKDKEISTQKVENLQKIIYSAMNANAISEKEGLSYISQIVEPLVGKQMEGLATFQVGNWNPFYSERGFSQIEELYESEIKQPYPKGETKEDPLVKSSNLTNRALLYDNYFSAVNDLSSKLGVPLDKVTDLPYSQQVKFYDEAFKMAKSEYIKTKNSKLAELSDLPNQVLSKGKLIAGMAGKRDIKPDFSLTKNYKNLKDKNGNTARMYNDGRTEEFN